MPVSLHSSHKLQVIQQHRSSDDISFPVPLALWGWQGGAAGHVLAGIYNHTFFSRAFPGSGSCLLCASSVPYQSRPAPGWSEVRVASCLCLQERRDDCCCDSVYTRGSFPASSSFLRSLQEQKISTFTPGEYSRIRLPLGLLSPKGRLTVKQEEAGYDQQ